MTSQTPSIQFFEGISDSEAVATFIKSANGMAYSKTGKSTESGIN
jgi:hypothetical protein